MKIKLFAVGYIMTYQNSDNFYNFCSKSGFGLKLSKIVDPLGKSQSGLIGFLRVMPFSSLKDKYF